MSLLISVHLLSDNGPCKQVCSVIGDTAMCSCFPGYAIMADGVSCEGEYHGGYPHTCANLSFLWSGPQGGDRTNRMREVVRI